MKPVEFGACMADPAGSVSIPSNNGMPQLNDNAWKAMAASWVETPYSQSFTPPKYSLSTINNTAEQANDFTLAYLNNEAVAKNIIGYGLPTSDMAGSVMQIWKNTGNVVNGNPSSMATMTGGGSAMAGNPTGIAIPASSYSAPAGSPLGTTSYMPTMSAVAAYNQPQAVAGLASINFGKPFDNKVSGSTGGSSGESNQTITGFSISETPAFATPLPASALLVAPPLAWMLYFRQKAAQKV